ncbi:MAG: acyl-CoA dehydrogenase family protein [Acidimicrobiales bacterium]
MAELSLEEVTSQVRSWIEQNWDVDLTVAEWWQLLADARYSHPMLPENAGGLGYNRSLARSVHTTMAEAGVIGPPVGLGTMLAGPTIAAHGTQEQIDRYLPPILNGQMGWCQLFSEPGAGSDLAGLQTRAEQDGDEWIINGQKVWTSGGHYADLGILIARTDPEQPKHQGISYFAFDMLQDGVEVRPLVEMTGAALFNEVFMTDARVHDDALIGAKGDGWRVANTTLTEERAALGAGGTGVVSFQPGKLGGMLDKRVGDLVKPGRKGGDRRNFSSTGVSTNYIALAKTLGNIDDPVLRQKLMTLHTLEQISKFNTQRARATAQRTGAEGNIAKLLNAEINRQYREVGNAVIGAAGMVMGEDTPGRGLVQNLTLFSPAPSIYGGTDQVQRNIIGERVLGLPKEPGPDKSTAFSQLPKNQ